MLKRASIPMTVKQLNNQIAKANAKFDIAVQRTLVWTKAQKSLLMHSLICDYPIPPFYAVKETVEDENGKKHSTYQFLDGKQRSNAIHSFLEDEFALIDVPSVTWDEDGTETEEELVGKKFSELSDNARDAILSYSLSICYFDELTDDELEDVFYRLNNGTSLSAVELSRTKAVDLEKIQEIGHHEIFNLALTAKGFDKYVNEDLVVKSYVMLTVDKPCLDTKAVRPIMQSLEVTDDVKGMLTEVYDYMLNGMNNLLDDGENKLVKKSLKRVHFVSLVPIARQAIEQNIESEAFAQFVKYFFSTEGNVPTISEDYNTNCTQGSGHTSAIASRMKELNKAFKKFMSKYEAVVKEPETVDTTEVHTEEDVPTITETTTETTVE